MKENYESLEMEVIAFDGEIFTGDSGPDVVPASGNNTSSVLAAES